MWKRRRNRGHIAANYVKTIIVQVNRQAQYDNGGPKSFIHVNDVTLICEDDRKMEEL